MSIPQKPLEKNQQYSINKKNIFKIFSSTNKVESNKKNIPQSPLFSIIKSEKNKFERTKKKIFFKSEKINTIIKNGKESPNANKKIKFNVTNNIDGNDLISYYGKNLIGKWKNDEHQRFIEGVKKYGNDWSLVQKYVRTRTIIQIRSHAQKCMKKLKKLKIFETNNCVGPSGSTSGPEILSMIVSKIHVMLSVSSFKFILAIPFLADA